MNWDISIGQCKRLYGRLLQAMGRRYDRRALVLEGERIEFGGRLQMRYGVLKHEAQWNPNLARIARRSSVVQPVDPRLGVDKRLSA